MDSRLIALKMNNATWKKIVLGMLLLLIAAMGGCVAFVDHLLAGLCAEAIIEQKPSPSGQLKAVVYQLDCGATTDFNSLVGIAPGDKVFRK